MDGFAAWSEGGGLAMSVYDVSTRYFGDLARSGTLLDNFFHSAYGGSFLNHQWLISGQTPMFPNAPDSMRAILSNGGLVRDGAVSPGLPSLRFKQTNSVL